MLQYEFSLRLLPDRAPLRDVFDSLQLESQCGVTPPPGGVPSTVFVKPLTAAEVTAECTLATFYVSVNGSDASDGSLSHPFATLPRAIQATRAARPSPPSQGTACVVLRGGVHVLAATVELGAGDSGLIITGFAGDAPAWISGGVPLRGLAWQAYNVTGGSNVWVASVAGLASAPSLNTLDERNLTNPPTRLFRAMYPNYDVEQWQGNLPGGNPGRQVVEWVKPPLMPIPTLFYKDLQQEGLKNDSTMREYNVYATGSGGPCLHWANDGDEWAYVCSNSTAGGWEFIEGGLATSGQLGFPVAMRYNTSLLPSFASWTIPPAASPWDWDNAPKLTVWHNQGWFQATYAVTALDTTQGLLNLSADGVYPAGGWQGGRTMENVSPYNLSVASPMGAGQWYIANVFEELDAPGEYFFDPAPGGGGGGKLYVFYNATPGTPPPPTLSLVASQLEVFFNVTGSAAAPVTDVTLAGLAFRDQRPAQLDRWHDPSGGDWGLRRAGAVHLEGTERANVSGCTFYRTDANSVFIAAYNRNATVADCEFAYIGMSAVATFGRTVQDDGTAGEQPWGTVIAYNKVHELGAFQLQSSAWFTSKACLTRAEGNVLFNGPRAMINVNDGFGGGNNITGNSIYNTCRQSGDHGPINSWDRMPFLTKIRSGGITASYSPALTETSHNAIIANYGASQGFDNDDGSSFYNTHDNWYWDAAGFKMDYGGHDSLFHDNVVAATSGQNCIGTASFVTGHADRYFNNSCIVYGNERVDDLFENCNSPPSPGQEMLIGYSNRYFTPNSNASATCDCCGLVPLSKLPAGLEDNFTSSAIPAGDVIIGWAREKLGLPPQ